MNQTLAHTQLGKKTDYVDQYDPTLLCPIPRQLNRADFQLTSLPFTGVDIWNAYELSWLNLRGKPQVALAEIIVPADSVNLIESKSLKLYLNSFNQMQFASTAEFKTVIEKDLSQAAQAKVTVKLVALNAMNAPADNSFFGILLDDLDISITDYRHKPQLLITQEPIVHETVYTHLFKSNCPVTQQPDWATVWIHYHGKKIQHENLLQYLISYRQHAEFHEHCCERIFIDILRQCAPEKLTVYLRFTRRGGLDINPYRSNFETVQENFRLIRQ